MDDINNASDEVRLQFVRARVENLMLCVKMQLTVQTTLEAYRQFVSGEIPEEFKEFVGSPEFKVTFDQAVKASTEILQNVITLTDELGVLFGHDFRGSLPKTAEQFASLASDISNEIESKVEEQEFNWNINEQE